MSVIIILDYTQIFLKETGSIHFLSWIAYESVTRIMQFAMTLNRHAPVLIKKEKFIPRNLAEKIITYVESNVCSMENYCLELLEILHIERQEKTVNKGM